MHLRKLFPLVIAAAAIAIPAQAHASSFTAGVPAQLQQWEQGLPAPQQDQIQQFIKPLQQPFPQLLPAPTPVFANNLDGWIRNAQFVLNQNRIPGSYGAIHRNIMRESGGNPRAINLYDSNAARGIPSKGLMQVIDPTFRAYHVDGTSWDIYDPVANITAACNYAAARYGSIDNVNAPY
jgi:Transglycosylase SLT domain